jgi:hypothetical protein
MDKHKNVFIRLLLRMVNRLITGTGLENANELLLKYQRDMNLSKLTEETIIIFFKKWVKLKSKTVTIKPYLLNSMSYYLLKIIHDRKILSENWSNFKSKIKKLTNNLAKKLFSNKLQEVKRAELFSMTEINQIANVMWQGNAMSKAAATKLRLTFMSGCRSGDLNSCYWIDIKETSSSAGNFYIFPMRRSKTNPRSLKKEHITIREDNDSNWSIKLIINRYKNYLIESKQLKRKIFPDKPTRAFVYYYEKGAKQLGFKRRLTGHSGRNSTLLRLFQANVKTEDICLQYHWKRDSAMVFRYRDVLLETTELGAPYALSQYDTSCNYNK